MTNENRKEQMNVELRELSLKKYRGIALSVFNSILDPIAGGATRMGKKNIWTDELDEDDIYPRLEWAKDIHSQLSRVLVLRMNKEHKLLEYNFSLDVEERGEALGRKRATIIFTYSPEKPLSEQRSFDP